MVTTTRIANSALRALLFVFSVIALGIEGHLRASSYNTARVNLGIAASTITLVLSVFAAFALLFIEAAVNIPILFSFDFISFVLCLSASASQTAQRHICHEPGRGKCGEFKTGFAFLYMDWIILFFLLILEIYQLWEERDGLSGGRGAAPYDSNVRRPATAFGREKTTQTGGYADREATYEPSPDTTPNATVPQGTVPTTYVGQGATSNAVPPTTAAPTTGQNFVPVVEP